MTETEFRIKHSEIIEYYQLIEMRLKSICAALLADEKKGWYERLDDFESNPMRRSINHIDFIQKQKKKGTFSEKALKELDNLCDARNYWAHECFGGNHPVCFNHGEVKNPKHAQRIMSDFEAAVEWDEKLAEILHERLIKPLVTEG